MHEILRYINEHIDEKLLTEQLACMAGYTPWYFCTVFKTRVGCTVNEYITGRRMRLAVVDLLHGDKITDIATRYGYDTPGGFDKAFSRYFGCAPRQYIHLSNIKREEYEANRRKLPVLSPRMELLRERAVEHLRGDGQLSGQRSYWFVRAYADDTSQHDNTYCAAEGLSLMLENFVPALFDDELLAGYNYPINGDGEVYLLKQYYSLTPQYKSALKNIINGSIIGADKAAWLTDTLENGGYSPVCDSISPSCDGFTAEQQCALGEGAAIAWCCTDGHSCIGHWLVAQKGYEGIIKDIEAARDAHPCLTEQQRRYYDAQLRVAHAAAGIGIRYADACATLASLTPDLRKRTELLELEEVCRRVPAKPARTFREAVQAVWFSHVINCWEDGINANSLGRLDQYLYPWYKADVQAGRITPDGAFELVCALWLKLFNDYDVQQCTVGGCDRDGKCAVNELSYIMLDATEALDIARNISVRFDCNTPETFVRRTLETVGNLRNGVPFFFNDEPIIKGLVNKGVALADARDYANIGCVETALPGMGNTHPVAVQLNVLKALEYVLFDGKSINHPGMQCGPHTGDPALFRSFSELMEAFSIQVRHLATTACTANEQLIPAFQGNRPMPYKSMLTEGCMKTGIDYNSGKKGPRYICYQALIHGLPNAIDSLMAIRTLVFEKKRCTMTELTDSLKNNHSDEKLRTDLLLAPKYGNDLDNVNTLASQVFSIACDAVNEFSGTGEGYFAAPFTFIWMFDQGSICAASPDGRKDGEMLAYSVSPAVGCDYSGLTALFNTLSNLPTQKAPGIASAIAETDPQLFCCDNLGLLTQLLLESARRGLLNVQFSITDRATLLAAQRNPRLYKNLTVRVSGYSQRFNLLDKQLQDYIIERTKHSNF